MLINSKPLTPSCHASTLVETAKGRLLAAWFGGKGEGSADVKIWLSHFDGKTWSEAVVVAEQAAVPTWNPVLFRLKDGRIALWYKVGSNPMSWTAFRKLSNDGGQTWSLAEPLPAGLLGPVRCKPIRLRDGSLLAGSSVESYRAWCAWIEKSGDDGQTWKRFGPIQVPGKPYGLIQPTLLVKKDGTVVALCRSNGMGFVCRSESKDNGESWSPAEITDWPNPNSAIDVVQRDADEWYMVWNPTKLTRFPLTVSRSNDGGASWKPFHTLENAPGEYSYPAIILGSDGRLHVTYTWNRKHIKYVALDAA